jgi:hypothetical protein
VTIRAADNGVRLKERLAGDPHAGGQGLCSARESIDRSPVSIRITTAVCGYGMTRPPPMRRGRSQRPAGVPSSQRASDASLRQRNRALLDENARLRAQNQGEAAVGKVLMELSMSLDGYVAGPDISRRRAPFRAGGRRTRRDGANQSGSVRTAHRSSLPRARRRAWKVDAVGNCAL